MTKRVSVNLTPGQERRLNQLCLDYGENKSTIIHRALDIMYFAGSSDQAVHLIEYLKTLRESK